MRRIRSFLKRTLSHATSGFRGQEPGSTSVDAMYLAERVRYLEFQVSRMSSLLRLLAGPQMTSLPLSRQTKESFQFQWDQLPTGRWNLNNPLFREEASLYVCEFTQLPKEWFPGKSVVDVGCGSGRYSWAMGQLGAKVLSADQSDAALERAAAACADIPGHRTRKIDLLKDIGIVEQFDLVWCFGVLHHTGDTYGAFKRLVPLVKSGGYLFLMLYGEPRPGEIGDLRAVNEYEVWREKTANMDFSERLSAIREGMTREEFENNGDDYVEGYFDAISPRINDLYRYDEVEGWLLQEGFGDIRRTVNTRNIHIVARRLSDTAGQ